MGIRYPYSAPPREKKDSTRLWYDEKAPVLYSTRSSIGARSKFANSLLDLWAIILIYS